MDSLSGRSVPAAGPAPRAGSGRSRAGEGLKTRAAVAAKDARRMPRRENVEGDFFVDHTCIDCDTCRWMAPDSFTRVDGMSAVTRQPSNPGERRKAMQALMSCPTFSIHVNETMKGEVQETQDTFPVPVEGCPGVYHCGFHNEATFGAASYFLVRPEGNVLVDVPRYNPVLARKLEDLGGIKWMWLSHKDDVADHDKWAKAFEAKRIIHETEVTARQGTGACEVQLTGTGPWDIDGAEDLEIIHTPGHTSGSICLYHKPTKVMFTGDHLAYSIRVDGLSIFPRYNSHSISIQLDSVRKLQAFDFLRILPGHGRPVHYASRAERDRAVDKLLATPV